MEAEMNKILMKQTDAMQKIIAIIQIVKRLIITPKTDIIIPLQKMIMVLFLLLEWKK